VNRNKRSLVLDIRSDAGKAALMRLVTTADVVVESFPPGFAVKTGLTYEAFKAHNPRVLLCSISAFGDGTLGCTMPGYDALVQAVSGLMSFTGSEGDATVRIAPSVLDLGTGMWAAMGLMAALARRERSGEGEHVRPALIDTAFTLMNHQLMGLLATGANPQKLGAGAPSAAPYGVWYGSDGEIMIATASEPQFPRLCAALGIDHLVNDLRFRTMEDRLANRAALNAEIAVVLARKSVDHWLETLSDAGISVGRVNDVDTALHLPVVRERALLVQLGGNGKDAALPQLRLPIDLSGAGPKSNAPRLDEHSREVLKEAGFSDGEIEDLILSHHANQPY
jgi:crotonobetainyl-CoA:carnitine CoA-transferase CaiB-like acyl-CoA transferase